MIVWNQPFTDLNGLRRTIERLSEFFTRISSSQSLRTLIVEVNVDSTLARNRVFKRQLEGKYGLSEEVFYYFVDNYKSVAGELPCEVLSVDGGEDPEVLASKVLERINNSNAR